jgi:hypothetical protein
MTITLSLPCLISCNTSKNYRILKMSASSPPCRNNIGQIHAFGLLPFGGGGISVSVPLAKRLTEEEVWERYMASTKNQGDQIVNDCLNDFSTLRPTFDMELHQMDINGDPPGYFESGRRLLTIHHWKSWFSVNVPMVANVRKACGGECVLQRWQFDGDTVLSNGYSIKSILVVLRGEA